MGPKQMTAGRKRRALGGQKRPPGLGCCRPDSLSTKGTSPRAGRSTGRHRVGHPPDTQFHLVCEECEQVVHHAGRLVEEVRTHLLSGHGFTARRVDLHVSGRCARCSS